MSRKVNLSIILSSLMIPYTILPCIAEAENIIDVKTTKAITYFYSGSGLTNEADNNCNMSTYLSTGIRTIINTNSNTIVESDINISDGKSVVAQSDTNGSNIDNTYDYTPYGASTSFSSLKTLNLKPKTSADVLNIWQNPFEYDSYYYDQESGLDYLQARYYNPTLMHFISMDTYDLANRYAYCNANPIGNMDPTGHNAVGDFFKQFTDEDFWKGMIPFYGLKNDIQDLEEGKYAAGVMGLIGDTWSSYTSIQLAGGALIGLKMLFTKSIKNAGKKEVESIASMSSSRLNNSSFVAGPDEGGNFEQKGEKANLFAENNDNKEQPVQAEKFNKQDEEKLQYLLKEAKEAKLAKFVNVMNKKINVFDQMNKGSYLRQKEIVMSCYVEDLQSWYNNNQMNEAVMHSEMTKIQKLNKTLSPTEFVQNAQDRIKKLYDLQKEHGQIFMSHILDMDKQ